MTQTFASLRERNNDDIESYAKKLEAKQVALNSVENKPSERRIVAGMSRARKQTEKLLDHRVEIENLASSGSQRTQYGKEDGAEKWHRDFILLRDVHQVPGVSFLGEELQRYMWSRVPHSRFKQFQELFVRPEHFAVPRFEVLQGGNIRFSQWYFNTMSLEGCLVSPDMISDELAAHLHLCEFTKHEDSLIRLRKKAASIPTLKMMWESKHPLQKSHQRYFSIERPEPTVRDRYQGAIVDHTNDGKILYIREKNGHGTHSEKKEVPPPFRKLEVHCYDSAYSALRKTGRQERLYRSENSMLNSISVEVKQLNSRINQQWKDTSLRPMLRESAFEIGNRCSAALKHVIDPEKTEALQLCQKFTHLQDSTGKENPMAVCSQMIAMIGRIRNRLADMNAKGSYNQRDQMTLESAITVHEESLQNYRLSLAKNAERLMEEHALFKPEASFMNDELTENIRLFESQLNIDPAKTLSEVTLEPFRTYREVLHKQYQTLQDILRKREKDLAVDQLIKMHVIGKYQDVRWCFEQMKVLTMDASTVQVATIREFVTTLREIFAKRQIFPDRTVPSYTAPFEAVCHELQVIEDRLVHYEGIKLDVGNRTEMYKNLKEYLDKFDIEQIVRSLD